MHSFHPSRGRIFFEVLCALTVSASCAGAWVQTGASAFLPAAVAAALYGLWHMTDMARPKAASAAGAAEVVPVNEDLDKLADHAEPAPEPLAYVAPEPEPVEAKPAKAPAKRRSRKKAEPVAVPAELPVMELVVDEAIPEVVDMPDADESHFAPVTPLFEPQPLVRQPRPVFGRKAG